MEIRHGPDGRAYVLRYDVGDLVRLRIDEIGDGAMGRAGHWGSIIDVAEHGGALTIQLAGYSEPRNAPLQRLIGISRSIVVPCRRNGVPIALPAQRPHGRPGPHCTQTSQRVVVNTSGALPAWAAALVAAGCTLMLVVAAGIAAKNFGLL